MKRQKYILNIDNPCKQDWSSMTQTEIGKYCSNCSKTVIDFSQLTDNDVIRVLEQTSGKLCGRLTKEQLDRTIEAYQPKNNTVFYKILAGLLLLITTKQLFAKDKQSSRNTTIEFVKNENPSQEEEEEREITLTVDTAKNIIRGVILDARTQEPVSFANIFIKDTKVGTSTDIDGKFEFLIPDTLLTDKIYLKISFVGYEAREVKINKRDLPLAITEKLIASDTELMVVGYVTVEKKKWWKRKKKSCP